MWNTWRIHGLDRTFETAVRSSGLPSPPRKKGTQGLESGPSVPFFDTVPALEKRSHTAAARPAARARPFAHPRITHRFGRHLRVGLRMGSETLHGRRVDALRHHNDSSHGHDLVSERNRRPGKGWIRGGWSVSARHSRFRLGMPAAVSGAGRLEGSRILVSAPPAPYARVAPLSRNDSASAWDSKMWGATRRVRTSPSFTRMKALVV